MLPSTSIRFGRPMGVSSGSVAFKKAKQAFTSSQHWAALSAGCVRPIGKRAWTLRRRESARFLRVEREEKNRGSRLVRACAVRIRKYPSIGRPREAPKIPEHLVKIALLPMGLTHLALNAAQCWDDVNACFAFLNATEPDETPIGRPNRIEVDGSILRQPNRFLGPYELHVYAEVRSCSAVPRKG